MDTLDTKLQELMAIHAAGKQVPEFDAAVVKILKEQPAIERVSLHGKRYSTISGGKPEPLASPGRDLAEVMKNQRQDLAVVRKQLKETIEAFRAVLPVADKGEFAALMLSGRAGFADRIQESVDMLGVFQQSYIRACMTTIAATMQIYPAGLKWLKDSTQQGRTPENK